MYVGKVRSTHLPRNAVAHIDIGCVHIGSAIPIRVHFCSMGAQSYRAGVTQRYNSWKYNSILLKKSMIELYVWHDCICAYTPLIGIKVDNILHTYTKGLEHIHTYIHTYITYRRKNIGIFYEHARGQFNICKFLKIVKHKSICAWLKLSTEG